MNDTSKSTTAPELAPLPLPAGFSSIEDIRQLPNDDIKSGKMVNVIGFIKDFQPPIPTRGSDHKCTLTITDPTIPFDATGLRTNIFWPANRMPAAGRKDIIVLRKGKLQMYGGQISLMANKASQFYLMSSNSIPSSLDAAATAPWRAYRYDNNTGKPTDIETQYVISMNLNTEDMEIPSDHEFEEKSKRAMNVKEKFSLLEDVRSGNFYDIMCRVIKTYDHGDRLTVYLSDYTANKDFKNYVYGDKAVTERDGDEYGYANGKAKQSDWPGPYGQRTIQLTAYDAHASYIRNSVTEGNWVLLLNVQIKFGKEGGKLEGYLRGDPNSSRLYRVEIMKPAEERSNDDPKYKAGLQRQREYEKTLKLQQGQLEEKEDALIADSKKRKNGEEPKGKNSKIRRQESRARAYNHAEKFDAKLGVRLNLNENIRSIQPAEPITSLKKILEPRILKGTSGPYDVAYYKANVRVVDYFPHKLEEFSVSYRPNDMDILSDYSGDEDTDLEEDMKKFRSGEGFADKKWVWRFALLLEDAESTERLWVVVANAAAQMLLNIEEDAANLRSAANKSLLIKLKEQMFKLWGELEERTSATLSKSTTREDSKPPPSSLDSPNSSPPIPTLYGQPEIDSDDDTAVAKPVPAKKSDTKVLKKRDPNVPTLTNNSATMGKSDLASAAKNKAFTCCIKQYAHKVDEDDPQEANAGPGKRWQRMFGMFGTQIL